MKLSAEIHELSHSKETITLDSLLQIVEKRGFGFLLVIIALPSALPVPAPGYATPFGILIFLLGLQMLIGKRMPWFPKKMRSMSLDFLKNPKMKTAITRVLQFFESFVRPRCHFIFRGGLFHVLASFLIVLGGMSMILPIPLTNTGPSLGILIIGLGLLEDDGCVGLLGLLVLLLGIAVSVTVIFFGVETVYWIKDFILNTF